MARADMEFASTDAPIVATGKCAEDSGAASGVIGVSWCGGDPGCHDGRSASTQAVVGVSWSDGLSGGDWEGATSDLLFRAPHLAVGRAIAKAGIADPGELVGKGASRLVVVAAQLHGERPGA